jgi:RNA-splicing ligase RtcB
MFIGDAYRDLEFLPMDLGGNEYLEDMGIAQLYAIRNRETILRTLVDGYFKQDYNKAEKISSIHNYINFQDKIIRKGAISAHAGEKILIPLNMRDGVAICMGKGNADWNFSAPHGLGRLYSRNKAKSELSMDEYKSEMSGIWTSCISRDTLDEAPMAYKNPDDVLGAITDTAEILKIIKPVYNFKAGKE